MIISYTIRKTYFLFLYMAVFNFGFATNVVLAQESLGEGVEARVNGEAITRNAVDMVEAQLKSASKVAISRAEIVNQLVDLAILSQAAKSNLIHQDPAIVETLKLQRKQTLANAYIGSLSQQVEVSDYEIRREYNSQVNSIEPTEFKARHILLDTKEEALDIIAKLNNGGEFAELAIEYSTDSSAASGGELGWNNIESYIPEFKIAVEAMEVGELGQVPIETKFGWHILNLLDTRGPPPPEYREVQSELKGAIVNRKVNEIVQEMRIQSNIVLKGSVETELEPSPSQSPSNKPSRKQGKNRKNYRKPHPLSHIGPTY